VARPRARDASTTTIVVMGVSGCGKSTVMRLVAARLGWDAAEGDAFHSAANIEKMRSGHELTDVDRWPWLEAIAAWIGQQEAAGRDAVVACSALKRAYRDVLRRNHPSVWFAHLVAPRDVIAARMARRPHHYMPASLLDAQFADLEPLDASEPGATVPAAGSAAETTDALMARLGARS
jgi:gluconokinase